MAQGKNNMPVTIPHPRTVVRQEVAPKRKLFTRKHCQFLVDNELLTEKYELINGEIIIKMSNAPHDLVVRLIMKWLVTIFDGLFVNIQNSINVANEDNETNSPVPDASVLDPKGGYYADRKPTAEELQLVVEVSDTTLNFDLKTKAALYSRAGIKDYWVIDINGRKIIVHREPTPKGYQEILEYAENEIVSMLLHPEASVKVSELLPPKEAM